MRGQRARAVVAEHVADVSDDVAEALARIGDEPLEWVGIAGELLAGTAVSRSACMTVAALMRFGLAEISPRHPRRLLFVQHYSAGMGLLADLHGETAALDELGDLLDAEVEGRAEEDLVRRYVDHARSLIVTTRNRSAIAALRHRYKELGEESVLPEMVRLGREIVHQQAAPDRKVTAALGVVGASCRERYQELGDLDAMADAIYFVRAAVETAADDSDKMFHLPDLSALLYFSYYRSGDEATHAEAVAAGRAAVEGAEGQDAIRALNNLASNLSVRYARTGDSRAMNEAIDLLERAVSMSQPDSPDLADRLSNLSGALHAKFLHTDDRAVLDRAVELGRRAVTMAADSPGRFGMQTELGVRLETRCTRYGDIADIEEAAEHARQVVAEMPGTDPDRPGLVAKAVMTFWKLYHATSRLEVLDEAITVARSELRDLPADHDAVPELWTALAAGLDSRYFDHGDIAAAHEARHVLLEAARTGGLPLNRINRYRLAAGLSRAMGEWRAAADAFAAAIGLLPMIASRRLLRSDHERQLGQLDGVVQDACACALQAGDPELAVTLLEHGRGILFALALENRDDLGTLRARHPDLAGRLENLRDRLAGELDLDEQHAQASLWDQLVAEIRRRPGFERFMLPAPITELLAAADRGPLVLFSISAIRSDALILTLDGIDVVPLPQATPEAVRERAQEFTAAVRQPPTNPDHAVLDTLSWLWEEITGPVLARLGPDPAHVWWCPTGPLSFLPLHAAGNEKDAVLDRVVSSYTPTIRALRLARRPVSPAGGIRALVVSSTDSLPGASREANVVAARVPATRLTERTADRARVLHELPRHPWVHFACHGESDPDDPSASHLLLPDHEVAPLTVVDISRLHLESADLAYLSACSTAEVGTTLTDEAIHLASAFQLAGYRHVVATLWSINDRHAAHLAEEVLLALSRMDVHGNWARIWVRTGHPAPTSLDAAEDVNHDDQATTWHGVHISGDLARSLSLVAEIATKHGMTPVPAGLLAYALLADEDTGAARALLAGDEIGHDELLALVEYDLLGPSENELGSEEPGQDTAWIERAEKLARARQPDDLDLVAVLVDSGAIGRAGNDQLLTQAHTELADEARLFGTRPAIAVVESAREEFGVMAPNAHQVVFALADRPSPALTALVGVTGVTTRQLAAGAMTELDENTRPRVQGDAHVWSIINLFLMFGAAVLILRHAVSTGGWWELVFLLAVFLGPPAVTAWVPAACAMGLVVFNPPAAAVLAAEAVVGWLRERAERGELTARTGVRLTLAEYRAFVARRKYTAATRARFDAGLAPLRASRLSGRAARMNAQEQA